MNETIVRPGSAALSLSWHEGLANDQVSIFYENENVRLTSVGQLPLDLTRKLKSLNEEDAQLLQYSYLLADIKSGYLGLIIGRECFIQRLGPLSSPYTFKVESSSSDVPCMAFLPNATPNSPPKLVSCTGNGAVQLWDNVQWATSSSSSPNHYLKTNIELDVSDTIKFLVACGTFGFILGSQKKLYFVSQEQGKFLHFTLSRHHTWSLMSFIRRHTVPDCVIDLVTACYSESSDGTPGLVYALTRSSILAWQVLPQGPNFIQEWFLVSHLAAIQEKLQSFDFKFVEMVATSQGDLVIVVQSNPARETALVLLSAPQPNKAISVLDIVVLDSSEDTLVKVFTVPYHGLSQDAAVVVQFPTQLILVKLGLGRQHVAIPIAKDRQLLEVHDAVGTCSCVLAGPEAGLLKFHISPPSALGARLTHSDSMFKPYQSLKSIFREALDQMDLELGPQLPEIRVDRESRILLNGVVTELVDEILNSRQSDLLNLESVLNGRQVRLANLATLLSVKDLAGQVSPDAHHHLASSSQKVEASYALYLHYLHRLSERSIAPAARLLVSALQALYLQFDSTDSDFVTNFFHQDVQRLPDLLVLVGQRASLPDTIPRTLFGTYGALMFEANTILLKAIEACKACSIRHSADLALDLTPSSEPWITHVMLKVLTSTFRGTVCLLSVCPSPVAHPPNPKLDSDWARTVDIQEVTDHPRLLFRALRIHLGGLGEHLLWLIHLKSIHQGEHNRELVDTIYSTLIEYQMGTEALVFAERHRDFRSLARLVTDLYPDPHAHQEKSDGYIAQFGDDFLKALLAHYASINRFSAVLSRGNSWPEQVSQFLAHPDYRSVAWIHDLGQFQYFPASQKLLIPKTHQNRILSQKAFLSIGKLALLTQDQAHKTTLDDIDNQLEFSKSQKALLDAIEKLSGEGTELLAPQISQAVPQQAEQFFASIHTLGEGQLLDFESFVDVLTIKDDWDLPFPGPHGMAIEACSRLGRSSGEDFNFAIRTIWRRVFLADDWAGIDQMSRENDGHSTLNLQDTLLYNILTQVLNKDYPPYLIIAPSNSLFDSSSAHFSIRYPRLPPTQISALLQEYENENTQLEELILQHRLSSHYTEIYRMANSDLDSLMN